MTHVRRHVPFDHTRLKLAPGGEHHEVALRDLFAGSQPAFTQFVQEDLENAYQFAQRELDYHESLNDLPDNEIDAHEIVDEAVAELLERKPSRELRVGRALVGAILTVMHRTVKTLEERERREVSIDANVKDPIEEGGFRTLGEHVLQFWQPDADQTATDVLQDLEVPSPAEILDMKERQDELYRALNALPRNWREAFVLLAVEQWPLTDIAHLQHTTVDHVRDNLKLTQRFLLDRLRAANLDTNRTPRSQPPHLHDSAG